MTEYYASKMRAVDYAVLPKINESARRAGSEGGNL